MFDRKCVSGCQGLEVGVGGGEEWLLQGTGFILGEKTVLELDGGDDCNTVNILKTLELIVCVL